MKRLAIRVIIGLAIGVIIGLAIRIGATAVDLSCTVVPAVSLRCRRRG
jgi:hypothetical protein